MLTGSTLKYFENEAAFTAGDSHKGEVEVAGVAVINNVAKNRFGFVVQQPGGRTLKCYTLTEDERGVWLKALRKAAAHTCNTGTAEPAAATTRPTGPEPPVSNGTAILSSASASSPPPPTDHAAADAADAEDNFSELHALKGKTPDEIEELSDALDTDHGPNILLPHLSEL